jgi:hypothetical protein
MPCSLSLCRKKRTGKGTPTRIRIPTIINIYKHPADTENCVCAFRVSNMLKQNNTDLSYKIKIILKRGRFTG